MNKEQEFWNKDSWRWVNHDKLFGPLKNSILYAMHEKLQPITQELPHDATIINLGAGANNHELNEKQIVAMDFSPQMLKHNGANRKVLTDLEHPIPLTDECADLVVSFLLIRYLTIPDQQALIFETHRVLKKGGWCYFADITSGHYSTQKAKFDSHSIHLSMNESNFKNIESHSKTRTSFERGLGMSVEINTIQGQK